ncbi:Cordon-bleu protein-like 1 [Channa argus]|uniref:Cordon-bleu protein-like 1 n=1 Tax=Channa argus TaxID=215402 RepID=A0A6G1QVN0_CHAAH|nr:Cordon-bleu protein-like 1 [Channa argus]
MDEHVNPLERDHSLCVVLPGGLEKKATVHGSKPVMDLLVTLCASYRLNPSDYTVEFLSPNKNNISFKPNSPVGSLEAEKVVLKPKGVEENIRRPYMPEATIRLLINYNKSHKAVVRVNPRVPLEMLLPVVCDKCEFKVETTVLLRDSQSKKPLDLNKTLNDHELREVFAIDTASKEFHENQPQTRTTEAARPAEAISPPLLQGNTLAYMCKHKITCCASIIDGGLTRFAELPKKEKKQKENTGFLSLFRRRGKKSERNLEGAVSAPASPGLKQVAVNSFNTLPADLPKKRRAPQPPMGISQSVPNNLSTCHLRGSRASAESTLRSTKRRAPPPPCANAHLELQEDTQVKGAVDTLNTLEVLRECDESDSVNLSLSSFSSPPSIPRLSSSFSRTSFAHLRESSSFRGKDISDARCALARVLTSPVSKGMLVKRLKNSEPFPKLHNGSLMSMAQRCADSGVFYAEVESVFNSNLHTESEWEDPIQRKGVTTFKVVPSKKQKSYKSEVTLDAPDQCQISVEDNSKSQELLEAKTNQAEIKEDSCSSNRSETGTPLPHHEIQTSHSPDSPLLPHDVDYEECPASLLSGDFDKTEKDEDEVTSEVTPAPLSHPTDEELISHGQINSEDQSAFLQNPSGQSGNTDIDHCSSCTADKDLDIGDEVEQEKEEDGFPSPPPPVFFNEDLQVEERGEDPTTSSLSSQPNVATCNRRSSAFEDHEEESASTVSDQCAAEPKPSRFAQAVALAVQRSRLQSQGKALGPQAQSGQHSTHPSTPTSTYQYGELIIPEVSAGKSLAEILRRAAAKHTYTYTHIHEASNMSSFNLVEIRRHTAARLSPRIPPTCDRTLAK